MKKYLHTLLALIIILTMLGSQAAAEPSSAGDGLVSYEDLMKLTSWLGQLPFDQSVSLTYENIVDYIGVHGLDDGNKGPNAASALGDHYFDWICRTDPSLYIHVGFRYKAKMDLWTKTGFSASGFTMQDAKKAMEAPASTPTEQPPAPAGDLVMDAQYIANTFLTGGVEIDASIMGVYTITFHEDGTCDYVMAGQEVPTLRWSLKDGLIEVDYFGTLLVFTPTEEGLDMDYFGSGTLKMKTE